MAINDSSISSNSSETLHYFRKLLKQFQVDEDYGTFHTSSSPLDASEGAGLSAWLPRSLRPRRRIPAEVEERVSSRQPWQIYVSPSGRLLAVVKRRQLEFYAVRKEMDEAVASIQLPADAHPQWRRFCWSADSEFAAVGQSSGRVLVYSVRGQQYCDLPAADTAGVSNDSSQQQEQQQPLAFVLLESGRAGLLTLLTVTVFGQVANFVIEGHSGVAQLVSACRIGDSLPVSCIFCGCYDPASATLVLGSATVRHQLNLSAPLKHGLQLWRRISEAPFLQASLALEEDIRELRRSRRLFSAMLSYNISSDCVISLSLSADAKKLAAAYSGGYVSLWSFPAGNMLYTFSPAEQGLSSMRSPFLHERIFGIAPRLYRGNPDSAIISVEWWSDSVLIVARSNGSVSLLDSSTCQSIMGTTPEWFEAYPHVTKPQEAQFLVLECEVRKRRLRNTPSSGGDSNDSFLADEEEEEEGEDGQHGGGSYTRRLVQATGAGLKRLFAIDSSDAPTVKRSRFVAARTYRIVCFKQTSPAELFQWKLDYEEFGEALLLAKNYGLDADLVFQRQWQKSLMTKAAIEDYLVRISKRNWVLHECVQRVPKDLDSVRGLLEFGLRATDVDCLVAIGNREDAGQLVLTDPAIYAEMNFTGEKLTPTEERDLILNNEQEYRASRLQNVNWQKLSHEQKELIRIRRQLLHYRFKLDCYEEVLGGRHRAPERFNADEFNSFRSMSALALAVSYARDSCYDSVDQLFRHFTDELLPYRLLILQNCPETDCPSQYEFLLPEAGSRLDEDELLDWQLRVPPPNDWSLDADTVAAVGPDDAATKASAADAQQLLAECEWMLEYNRPLTKQLVADWFQDRARDIEEASQLPRNALTLLQLASAHGFHGFETLQQQLQLLTTIVYDCAAADYLRLSDLNELSELERAKMLVSRRNSDEFLRDCRQRLLPHAQQLELHQSGASLQMLRQLLLWLAADHLDLVAAFVAACRPMQRAAPLLNDWSFAAECGVAACFACDDVGQLEAAARIADALVSSGALSASGKSADDASSKLSSSGSQAANSSSSSSSSSSSLPPQLPKSLAKEAVQLRDLIASSRALAKHRVLKSPAELRRMLADAEQCRLLLQQIVRKCLAQQQQQTVSEQTLASLLRDLGCLAASLLNDSDENTATQILVAGMLGSGQAKLITQAATNYLNTGSSSSRSSKSSSVIGSSSSSSAVAGSSSKQAPSSAQKLNYKLSSQLLIDAAIDYYDSAANYSDSSLELARHCLTLLPGNEPAVIRELRLMEALQLLEQFGLSVLPVTVRMHKQPEQLIGRALQQNGQLYSELQQLYRISDLLGVKRETAQLLAGETALQKGDVDLCQRLCQQLAESDWQPAWQLCRSLLELLLCAESVASRCGTAAGRLRLARFCCVNCSHDCLEACCQLLAKAELQSIAEQLANSTDHDEEVVSEASVPESSESREQFSIAATVFYSQEDGQEAISPKLEQRDQQELRLAQLLQLPDHERPADYDERVSRQLARLASGSRCLRSTLLAFEAGVDSAVAQQQLLNSWQPGPELYALLLTIAAYRLLAAVANAAPVVKESSSSSSSCEEARLALRERPLRPDRLRTAAERIVAHLPHQLQPLVQPMQEQLEHYQRLLMDCDLANRLLAQCPEVNLGRFVSERQYKIDTILGVAMTTDIKQLQLALTLASRYEVSSWEVRMCNAEHLFNEEASLSRLQAALPADGEALSTLLSNADEFCERMRDSVLPGIAGTDLGRLLHFYTLLQTCPQAVIGQGVTVGQHLKLLRKLRPAVSGLDYKLLLNSAAAADPAAVLQQLRSVLTAANVHVLAKLAPVLSLAPSAVFALWAAIAFWAEPLPQTDQAWMHRYESIGQYLGKVTPSDFVNFVKEVTFGQKAAQLSQSSRLEILQRAAKFCGSSQRQQKAATASSSTEAAQLLDWSSAQKLLREWPSHSRAIADNLLPRMRELSAPDWTLRLAEALGPDSGDAEQLVELLLQPSAESDQCSLDEQLQLALAVADATGVGEALPQLVRGAAARLVRDAEDDAQWIVGVSDLLDQLRARLEQEEGQGLEKPVMLDESSVLQGLRDCLSDTRVQPERKSALLDFVVEHFDLQRGQLVPIVAEETARCLGGEAAQFADAGLRCQALADALRVAADSDKSQQQQQQHLEAARDLLQIWEKLASTEADEQQQEQTQELLPAWLAWTETAFAAGFGQLAVGVLRQESKQHPAELYSAVFHSLVANDDWDDACIVAQLALADAKLPTLFEEFLSKFSQTKSPTQLSASTLQQLVSNSLVGKCVRSPIYSQLVQILLQQASEQGADSLLQSAANQLLAASFQPEAAWLLMKSSKSHSGLSLWCNVPAFIARFSNSRGNPS